MLRISQASTESSSSPTLRLDGQVAGPWVDELRRVCFESLRANGQSPVSLVLDLSGVSFLDPDGVALFRELSRDRVLFTNGSAFVAEQLKGVADVQR